MDYLCLESVERNGFYNVHTLSYTCIPGFIYHEDNRRTIHLGQALRTKFDLNKDHPYRRADFLTIRDRLLVGYGNHLRFAGLYQHYFHRDVLT